MLMTESLVLEFPAVEETVAQLDATSYAMAFYFQNLHSSPLELTVQSSSDGGATWADVSPTPVNIDPGDVLDIWVESVGPMLRIRGAGGPGSMYFGLAKFVIPTVCVAGAIRIP